MNDLAAITPQWTLVHDADGVSTLVFDQPGASVNTLSAAALDELRAHLSVLAAARPAALVIRSGKAGGFIAGADIDEFVGLTETEQAFALVRRGWDTFELLASLPFPTLALVRGFCLGGGLELALACRYRVAVDEPATRLGLPEVMLGIVPAWGGIRRLPRLVGAPAALDLLLTGKTVDARRAHKLGLVDEAVPPRIMENAVRGVLRAAPPPRTLPFPLSLTQSRFARSMIAQQARKKVAQRARPEHYPAPYAILDIWSKYDGDALAVPRDDPASIARLLETPAARNLIRLFKLQERLKGLGNASAAKSARVHVVGGGTMGGDIAAWCALRGLQVTLQDQSAERLKPAIQRAAGLFAERLKDPRRLRDAFDRLVPDVAGDGIAHADIVIEAIFEDLAAKRELFARIESKARPDAILATNTSSIPLEEIARGMTDARRLIGVHFFNPVAKMMLVEIVLGGETDPALLPRVASFVRQIDKLPLPVKSAPGFLVNRVLAPYLLEAMRAVDEGVAPEAVDEAARRFGMPMGPIELADSVGLDICMAVGRMLADGREPPRRLSELIAAGHLGRKTGRGYYDWSSGKAAKGEPGTVAPALTERLLRPLLQEARRALEAGVVADADLVDAGAVFGTGFAPFTGGPMNYLREHPSAA